MSELGVGSVFAGYTVERLLGAGGMGSVYLARSPDLPRSDALKVLSPELSRDADFRARFVREADVAAGLDHPNIVSVYRRGEFDGQLWIAMQFVDGVDADEAVRRGAMTPARAVHVVAEIAKAVDYAHARGVLHRDIKPANFLLSGPVGADERVLLGDFGIARAVDDAGLTMTGAVLATVAYAAPETFGTGGVDGRADLYSLGCSLFRLLTGQKPFESANGMAAMVAAHLHAPPPRVSDRLVGLSPRMDAVIATAMAKDPAGRFSSGRELAEAARQALAESGAAVAVASAPLAGSTPLAGPWGPSAGWPVAPPGVRRRRWPVVAGVAVSVVLAVLAGVVLVALRDRRASDQAGGPAASGQPTDPAESTAPTETTATGPTLVPASTLPNLLATPAEAAELVGSAGMRVTANVAGLVEEETSAKIFGDCVGAFMPAWRSVYTPTGWTAARFQQLDDTPDAGAHIVFQAVISYPSAAAAEQSVTDQKSQWSHCSGQTFMVELPDRPVQYTTFGPVTDNDGVVTITQARDDIDWRCQRAMTVRDNVIVDVDVCRSDLTNQGIDLLQAIAAKMAP